jgi:hypothetical protein
LWRPSNTASYCNTLCYGNPNQVTYAAIKTSGKHESSHRSLKSEIQSQEFKYEVSSSV